MNSNDFMRVIKDKTVVLLCLYSLLSCNPVFGDGGIADYDRVAAQVFWDELFPFGGWTLYCGYRFEHDRKTKDGKPVAIEHIYPAAEMMKQLGCGSRMQCRESGNNIYTRMEADMHNLYPVWNALVTYRNGARFGEIAGEEWRFEDCDIEWRNGVLEPRPLARGNIARSMLYMHEQYRLGLEPGIVELMVRWHRADPPSNQEIERNDRIEAVQGNRNPFVDNPARADRLLPDLRQQQ